MPTAQIADDVTIDFGAIELTGQLVHTPGLHALELYTDEGPEHISVHLGGYGLEPADGNVHIKDWSEHSGLAERMAADGLVQIVGSILVGSFASRAYEVKVLA